MVEGRLQRNPKWSGLRMDFAEMCDMRRCVTRLKEDCKEIRSVGIEGSKTAMCDKRRCVIRLKEDIKENLRWWVCGECTCFRLRIEGRY